MAPRRSHHLRELGRGSASASCCTDAYQDAPVSTLMCQGRAPGPRLREGGRHQRGASAPLCGCGRCWRRAWSVAASRLGAASFDRSVGVSHRTGQITHHIDPDLDTERQVDHRQSGRSRRGCADRSGDGDRPDAGRTQRRRRSLFRPTARFPSACCGRTSRRAPRRPAAAKLERGGLQAARLAALVAAVRALPFMSRGSSTVTRSVRRTLEPQLLVER